MALIGVRATNGALVASFEGEVVEESGSKALVRFTKKSSDDTVNQPPAYLASPSFLDAVDKVPQTGAGWAGKKFDLQVGIPPTTPIKHYKGCEVIEPASSGGDRISYERVETRS